MAAIRRKKANKNEYYEISKVTILKRLQTANLYEAARTELDQQEQFLSDLWTAAQVIRSNDTIVRALLNKIGADADAILARE